MIVRVEDMSLVFAKEIICFALSKMAILFRFTLILKGVMSLGSGQPQSELAVKNKERRK
jgi:hypothetical protein